MATRIRLRRGTAAQWAAENPVLALGEVGLETDTRLAKMGDGSTAWNSLHHFIPEVGAADTVAISDGNRYVAGPIVQAGSFTPTHSNEVGLQGAPVAQDAFFHRIGNIVHVFGSTGLAQATQAETMVQFEMTIPVPRGLNFTGGFQCPGGLGTFPTVASNGEVIAVIGAQRALLRWRALGTGQLAIRYFYAYEIVA